MMHGHAAFAMVATVLSACLAGCTDEAETEVSPDPEALTASGDEHDRDDARGEHEHGEHGQHDRDGHEHHGEEGEESGTEFALDETYDETRQGARLILAYDADSNSFNGTIENTTDEVLERVRVEVHLSNGREIGPTTPADLEPGEKREVSLTAESDDFDGWSAHPEVGSGEHGEGGEHAERERGEHGGEGEEE